LSIAERILREDEKRPSASIAQRVRTGDVCILLIARTLPTILWPSSSYGASMKPSTRASDGLQCQSDAVVA
jgi:hypothetical protein